MNQKPLFLAVALTTLLVIGGVFWMMQKRQAAVNQPVVTDPVVQTPAQTESEKYPQHIEAIPGNTDEVWYNIPELGIRMKLNKEFAEDLIYSYSKSNEKVAEGQKKLTTPFHETVHFSSRSLLRLEPSCEPGKRAIGYFIKEAGSIGEWPTSYYVGHTQFTDTFVVFGIPEGEDNPNTPMCFLDDNSMWSLSKISNEEMKEIENLVEKQSTTLKSAFASAEEVR